MSHYIGPFTFGCIVVRLVGLSCIWTINRGKCHNEDDMPIILHIIYDIVYSLSKNNTDACVDGCLPRLTQMLFRAIGL